MKKENQEASLAKIVLVANLYYKNGFSQEQISKMLQVSRPWVSKLLTKAMELGIVEIRVNASVAENRELSDKIRLKYGLKYASAVADGGNGMDNPAAAAANYFVSQLHSDTVVGIGWGNSVSRIIEEMPEIQIPNVKIVPIAGSFGISVETMPNYVAMQIAKKIGGTTVPLHAPAFCSSDEEYETMRNNPVFSSIIKQAERADIVLVGIGALDDSIIDRIGVFTKEQVSELQNAGAIGDIAMNFIDANGTSVETDTSRRIISADLGKLVQNAKEIIVYAEGKEKVRAIHAALVGGYVTSFITSEETALELLEL